MSSRTSAILLCLLHSAAALTTRAAQPDLPTLEITRDNTLITSSCRIVIAPGTIIPDQDNNGVIQVQGDNIIIEFAPGSALFGALVTSPGFDSWDTLAGHGLIARGTHITIRNARIGGYKVGLLASVSNHLAISGGDFSDNYRQRLKSTPAAEDASDWLWPHKNDNREWATTYGAALLVERSSNITIHDVVVRRGQNGIILDRVNGSSIYDNDCSFLSGWGLAMWRSSSNIIARNALDFCVRGYSHGIYNRGQDSAGILCFEQSSSNIFAENSVTHGGDGFFGFAGKEAIGENPPPPGTTPDYTTLGCNRNLLIANDFSYAPAHGIEMTFSRENAYIQNRIVSNAICGIWGGYSSSTLIAQNEFIDNGSGGYGLERGGINIEHGSDNVITDNTFSSNACGIHLWWDNDAALLKLPGVKANHRGVTRNLIVANTFDGDAIALQLRDASGGKQVTDNVFANNTIGNVKEETRLDSGINLIRTGEAPSYSTITPELPGSRRPVAARVPLRGRDKIIMGEWGPWDHTSPMVRQVRSPGSIRYEIYGAHQGTWKWSDLVNQTSGIWPGMVDGKPMILDVSIPKGGVSNYEFQIDNAEGFSHHIRGTAVGATWSIRAFPWPAAGKDQDKVDPRTDLAAWRALSTGPTVLIAEHQSLDLPFAHRGPNAIKWDKVTQDAKMIAERFGIIATTTLTLPVGRWRIKTLSDDGIRVLANGKPIIERWNWHGPTPDEAILDITDSAPTTFVVEYFEIDGYAVLSMEIEPIP
jgi:nitrous oxidase accessory protein NosD